MGLLRRPLSNQKGLSLAELMVALGVGSVVIAGVTSLLLENTRVYQHSQSEGALMAELTSISRGVSSGKCHDTVKLATDQTFNASGSTPAHITQENGHEYEGDTVIDDHSSQSFRIDRIYFDDSRLVSASPTSKIYSTQLYVEASTKNGSVWAKSQKKPVAAVALEIDNSGNLTSCDTTLAQSNKKTLCETTSGMKWNESTQACYQEIQVDSSMRFNCPDGMVRGASGACLLSGSSCPYNTLPVHFGDGLVETCQALPSGNTVQYPPNARVPGTPTSTDTPQQQPAGSDNAGGHAPASTTPTTCVCGSSTIPDATISPTSYCVQSRKTGNLIGGLDFSGDVSMTVKNCINGELKEFRSYIDEESSNHWDGWQAKTCIYAASHWPLPSPNDTQGATFCH